MSKQNKQITNFSGMDGLTHLLGLLEMAQARLCCGFDEGDSE